MEELSLPRYISKANIRIILTSMNNMKEKVQVPIVPLLDETVESVLTDSLIRRVPPCSQRSIGVSYIIDGSNDDATPSSPSSQSVPIGLLFVSCFVSRVRQPFSLPTQFWNGRHTHTHVSFPSSNTITHQHTQGFRKTQRFVVAVSCNSV